MEISETKKPNKYAALVTYLVAVVCLLLGLFLPLFNGKGILALCLPDVFNHIIGNDVINAGNKLDLAFSADLFGTGVTTDLMAFVILFYVIVTFISLLALIPIGLTFNGETGVPFILEYIVTVAASVVMSLYVILALQLIPAIPVSINMLVAFGGSILALAVLSVINKKGTGVMKVFLCLLSAVALFLLFDLTVVIQPLATPLENMGNSAGIFPAMLRMNDANVPGIAFLTLLLGGSYGANFTTVLLLAENVAQKITCCVAVAAALIVVINYLIDVVSLTTNAKKVGLLFNLIRYGLALLILVLLLIMLAASKLGFGLFTIILTVVVLIQVLVSVLRFIRHLKKVDEDKRDEYFASQTIKFAKPVKQPKHKPSDEDVQDIPEVPSFVGAEPIVSEPIVAETIEAPAEPEGPQDEQMAFIEPAPEAKEEEVYEEPLHEHPDEVQLEMEEVKPLTVEPVEPEEEPVAEPESFEPYYIPDEKPAAEPEGSYETQEPYEPEEQTYDEPVIYSEPVVAVDEPDAIVPEEPEPEVTYINGPVLYEEQPEVTVSEEPEVAATEPEPEEPAPVEVEPEPVVEVKPEPQPEPVREVPVRVEIKPAQERPAPRPYIDKRIYTEMYEHTDSFINKLTESEKTEFTRTFIEKANGDLGKIPEYVIGGNNKKFFSAVFIYLGRIRGMISDGLLNKMFKELNML